MAWTNFHTTTTWVFDLDNTLYPPQIRLFDQIEARMRTFMTRALNISQDEADMLRAQYWKQYGTTLAGLMAEHDMEPDPFLLDVHQIDFSILPKDPILAAAIDALPGRKIIYTNGTAPYAREVAGARGVLHLFDAIYGIEHAGYHPKPRAQAFEKVFSTDGLNPKTSVMVEDELRNLTVPYHLGMRTIHVHPEQCEAEHVHHHTDDLTQFLAQIVAMPFPDRPGHDTYTP